MVNSASETLVFICFENIAEQSLKICGGDLQI